MENLDSFQNVQKHFEIWAPERRKVLAELATIRDEIQRQIRIHSIGSITYSSVGLIGGGLAIAGIATFPFTLGVSLALTVAGVATGLTSGVADLTHGVVKTEIIRKQCNDAIASLEKHVSSCEEMYRLVLVFKKDIASIPRIKKTFFKMAGVGKGIRDLVQSSRSVHVYRSTGSEYDVAYLNRIHEDLSKFIPSFLKDTSKGFATFSTTALSIMAAAGIMINLVSIYQDAGELTKIERGKLRGEAEKLNNVIKELQKEYDCLKKFFRKKHSVPLC